MEDFMSVCAKENAALGLEDQGSANKGGNRPRQNNSAGFCDQYLAARVRLNATLDLINRALDLRALLECGLDMDEVRDLVAEFVRAARQHRGRP